MSEEPLTVACLDAEGPVDRFADRLDGQSGVRAVAVDSRAALLERVATESVDGVVTGARVPGPEVDGIDVVQALRERAPDLPVVVCTGVGDEATAARAVDADATAYVRRGESGAPDRVVAALEAATAASDEEGQRAPATGTDDEGGTDDGGGTVGGALRALLTATAADTDGLERLEAVLDVGREWLGLPVGYVTRVDDSVQMVATRGDWEPMAAGAAASLAGSFSEAVIERGSPVVRSDVGQDGDVSEDTHASLRCRAGVPVSVRGRPYGTLCFAGFGAREPFSADEVALLELLGRCVGHELERCDRRSALEQRTDRLDELSGIVTHDLRNPMAIAGGQLDLAKRAVEEGVDREGAAAASAHFDRANEALDRMSDVVDRALRFAEKGRRLDRSKTALSTLAERAWRRADTGDATLTCTVDRRVEADAGLTVELLWELFANAVEHGDADRVRVVGTDEGFAVADDGDGIPADDRGRLFQRGSADGPGAGLGLHVVARIAAAHDWSVRTDTAATETEGACFEVVTDGEAGPWLPGLDADAAPQRSGVDDD